MTPTAGADVGADTASSEGVVTENAAPSERCEVFVIGGGPAGAATAAFMRQEGLDVVIVEKERHPRFHVGESLLPHSLPILDRLGVLERVREIGVEKPGAEFVSPCGEKVSVFDFNRSLTGGPGGAYQVRRQEFDALLFERAVELGARALEETEASVLEATEQGALVETRGRDGVVRRFKADFLIDASGRSTLLGRMRKEVKPDPRSTSAAIFGHFRGVPRADGPNGGNIRIHLADPGWMWQIPLPNGLTSIGYVAPGDYLSKRQVGIEAFFHEQCQRYPSMRKIMAASEPLGEMRATGNFAYRADVAAAPCHFKVGDAYGFIDPIFSTGVHLALYSAEEATAAVLAAKSGRTLRARAAARYHRKVERRLNYISWFITRIQSTAFRNLMLNPRDIFGVERAIIALLAGDFRGSFPVLWRLWFFKLLWKTAQLNHRFRGIKDA